MTGHEAGKVFRWFKREIGLAGWTADITQAKAPRMFDVGSLYGKSETFTQRHHIDVWINPDQSADDQGTDQDWIVTLMHELMHAAFCESNIEYQEIQEYLIDRIAIQLASQYRQWLTKS